jgi:hypothetical protein
VPAQDDDELLGVHPDQDLAAQRPRGPADRRVRVLDARGGRADDHDDRGHRRPAQRRGPAGELLGPLAADEGVDDERLQPRVPGAAVLGEAGVDVRGGEGDLAAELEDGEVQRLLVPGLGHGIDVVLEDVDGHFDQVDGLLERHHPHQLARRGAEHLAGELRRPAGVAAPLDERGDPGLRHEGHPRPTVRRHRAEPGQLVVHPGHGLGGQ